MSLEKQLRLCYNNNQVDLIVDMGVGIGGDKWPAAEKFCYFLTNRHWKEFYQQLLTNKTCLELGSGNGLVGILISKVFAISKVVITDLSSHINLIERNVKLNKMDSQRQCPILDNSKDNSDTVSCSSVQNNICEVLSCDWFDKNPLSNHKYDFIFVLEW